LAGEDSELALQEMLLASLKPAIGWKVSKTGTSNSGYGSNLLQIHKVEEVPMLALTHESASAPVSQAPSAEDSALFWRAMIKQLSDTTPENKNKNNENKNTNSSKNNNNRGRAQQKKQNNSGSGLAGGNGNNQQNRNQSSGRGKEQGNRSKSCSRLSSVAPWPKGKRYLNGNQLTNEILAHFSDHCFRCGLNNHRAASCRFYDKAAVIILCNVCMSGFHDECKNPRFVNQKPKPKAIDHLSSDTIKKLHEKVELLEQLPNFPMWYPLPPPFTVPIQKMLAVRGAGDSSDDE
jgi:hypothetical protein